MSSARWAVWIGRAGYWHGKGRVWTDTLKPIAFLALGGGAALKYLTDLPAVWVVTLMLGLAVASEILAVLLGWLEHRSGATEAHFQAAADTDPYKRESLELARAQVALLREIRERHQGGTAMAYLVIGVRRGDATMTPAVEACESYTQARNKALLYASIGGQSGRYFVVDAEEIMVPDPADGRTEVRK